MGLTDYESATSRAAANYDLRRVVELLMRLRNPHMGIPAVHLAGTKGKGSTASLIASVMSVAGYRTGLYTSPHLLDFRERICLDGKMISKDHLVRLMASIRPLVDEMNAHAYLGKITSFEVMTALAFEFFHRQQATFQVIETGLGGRLDATNVITPNLSVLTPISLDHTEVLGDSLDKIAAEKAGIIKQSVPVVSAAQRPEAMAVIRERCLKNQSRLIEVSDGYKAEFLGYLGNGQLVKLTGRLGEYCLCLSLLGHYQRQNALTAVASLEVLIEAGFKISPEDICEGFRQARWPGRFEVIKGNPLLVIDGAHNEEAVAELVLSLEEYPATAKIEKGERVLVFGTSFDKDAQAMAALLGGYFGTVVLTRSAHPRAMKMDLLKQAFEGRGLQVLEADGVPKALELAGEISPADGLICATGSLFVAAEALKGKSQPRSGTGS
ncbi:MULTISPECIES: bifunctional folylpolyglutamate synthase/dihydrofolate synthase [Dehalococcoides]|uniref:tetrahydrofolate synthase n=1 Tax=Dehalococcoides mccartyi TaxID=61435 RepID=A0A1S6SF02_9CHLR|nr:folylpolyglutamate synthase/dihydrofolate synthase family protein [Dehalococcoides mccartyi]AQU05157.1 bifunctional folylpolyglutamate synthase/dihydrofolate synthase [Dehalococcoides mccartyi]AQU06637.1 bifunctional folylpolyglutamate synthase/dihydrofolate synthase [Dehalococcoides mccartyi]AQW61729.1 bifunctional folylpolyglutamate synthase/dihydrofolate synthase [Dehalococcoides mccartyi]AQX72598.1 bifunctional folylpolyglutamate synthase/dihydrofolate synthase [Dehalococcoides mccartyi]